MEDFRHRVGSSPLARGLRVRRPASGRQGGIIPARAGFTGIERALYGESADHPRSRGVYPPSTSPPSNGRGSSPLARGLQEDRARQGDDDGIIPARAGFTRRAAARSRPEPDHPRSRGVYREPIRDGGIPLGSSPLARGLHIMVRGKAFYARIIPARAGFTRPVRSSSTRSSDHPRSRGVYPATVDASSRPPGSSPLARGLRLRQTEHLVEIGIIPARAGFTRRRSRCGSAGGDHPRSRGVYSRTSTTPPRARGSSPLARGLRVGPCVVRILVDHPRSRGVY